MTLLSSSLAIGSQFNPALSQYIERLWQQAKQAKQPIEKRMLDAQRQRKGEYDPATLAEIKRQGGSSLFMMLTAVKCRSAEGWLREVLLPQGDKAWGLTPTAQPDIAPHQDEMLLQEIFRAAETLGYEITEELADKQLQMAQDQLAAAVHEQAQEAALRMERLCHDQQQEGGYQHAFADFLSDLVTFPAAFLKGPIMRQKAGLQWLYDADQFRPEVENTTFMQFERVSPYDIYPSPAATAIDDGYLFERHRLSRSALYNLIGLEGYDETAIRHVLDQHQHGKMHNWLWTDSERRAIEDRPRTHTSGEDAIDALQFWGNIPGYLLAEWGIEVDDLQRDYPCEIWQIGQSIIRASLNPHPLGVKPYCHTSFEKLPGSFWGKGIPELMKDIQAVCNASMRALMNNMGISSGPQVEVDVNRLAEGEPIEEMFPWKIWQVQSDPAGNSGQAIRFYSPESNMGELTAVYDRFSALADNHTGVPSGQHDIGVSPGAGTATGISLLMSAQSKGIRAVISNIDIDVIGPLLKRQVMHNMLYHEDSSIKGDVSVVPRGAAAMLVKELTLARRADFLQSTNNPTDMEIIGVEGRTEILREIARTLDMPVERIIPERELRQKRNDYIAATVSPEGEMSGDERTDIADEA